MKRVEEQNIIIGKRLKEYRENKGYTQEEVAKEIDVNPKHYGRIERGENSCTISNLVTLCNLFGISSDLSMQAVAVGFIIGVIYDSCETALNSAGDVFFTATAEYYNRRKNREPVNYLGEFAK